MSRAKLRLLIVFVWVYDTIIIFIAFMFMQNKDGNMQKYQSCYIRNVITTMAFYSLFISSLYITVIVISILYVKIIINMRKRDKYFVKVTMATGNGADESQKVSTRVTKSLMLVLSVFLILNIIMTVGNVMTIFIPTRVMYIIYDFLILLFFVNTFVNPIIYWFKNHDLREQYVKLLGCKKRNVYESDSSLRQTQTPVVST